MKSRIFNIYGAILILLGASMLLPLFVALFYHERSSVRAFSLTILLCLVTGAITRLVSGTRVTDIKLKQREGYVIVAATWLIASLVGCLPYLISGSIGNFCEAVFETASGFTTTGATIISDVEALPRSILLWRSFTQWLGGMGIVVLFVALLPSFGIKARNIAKAETPGPTVTRLTSRYAGTAQKLYVVYIGLTVALVILLMTGGLSLYDAVNHSFTTMATGGFSTYNDSIGHFHNNYISWIITLFMFIAGTNFELFFMIFSGQARKALKNEEFRLYAAIVVTATIAVTADLMIQSDYTSIWQSFTDAAFQITTIISTTGFATTNFDLWPTFCQMVLFILMVTGASSSSTSGGIKIVRILALFKMFRREVRVKLHGNIVRDVAMDGRRLTSESVTYLIGFISMYFITLILGTFIISMTGEGNLVTNLTACLSCISNVGPGLDNVGPICTYEFYSGFSKIVLSMIMIAGRLELSTFFILFSRFFWNPHRV